MKLTKHQSLFVCKKFRPNICFCLESCYNCDCSYSSLAGEEVSLDSLAPMWADHLYKYPRLMKIEFSEAVAMVISIVKQPCEHAFIDSWNGQWFFDIQISPYLRHIFKFEGFPNNYQQILKHFPLRCSRLGIVKKVQQTKILRVDPQ